MNLDNKLTERNILYRLLSTFNDEEWVRFEKFADSPFYNKGRNFSSLIKYLKKFRPLFDSIELEKEKVYKALYPGKEYKENVMYSLFSRLYSLAEEFIVQMQIEKDDFIDKKRLKIAAYRSRHINQKAISLIANYEKDIKRKKKYSAFNFDMKEFSKEIAYFYYENNQRHKLWEPVNEILNHSLYWFIVESSLFLTSLSSQKNFLKSGSRKSLFIKMYECIDYKKLLALIKQNDKSNYTVLYLHYLSITALETPYRDEPYFEMKNITFKHLPEMDKDNKNYFLNSLAKLCTLRFVAGDERFRKEAFEIRKKAVEEELFSFNADGSIRVSEFRSTFIDALNVNEIKWAETFYKNMLSKLNPNLREDIENYCIARLSYEKKDYGKAVLHANKVNINQIFFKLDIKNLISKTYYETESVEPLYSVLNSYYQLINNYEKKDDDIPKRHLNFIKFMRKICAVKFENKNKTDLGFIRKKLAKENVNSKSWLVKKIEILAAGY